MITKFHNFRSHILQADSAEMLQAWICALQKSIGAAIQHEHQQSRPPSVPGSNALNNKKKMYVVLIKFNYLTVKKNYLWLLLQTLGTIFKNPW